MNIETIFSIEERVVDSSKTIVLFFQDVFLKRFAMIFIPNDIERN